MICHGQHSQKKSTRGKPYYYARECKRIDGKPKIGWQQYRGKADDIVAAMTQRPDAAELGHAVVTDFGAVAALYHLAQRRTRRAHGCPCR